MNALINEKLEAMRQQLEGGSKAFGPTVRSTKAFVSTPGVVTYMPPGAEIAKHVAKLAKMTDDNDHTGARVYLARTFFPANKKLIKAWEGVAALHLAAVGAQLAGAAHAQPAGSGIGGGEHGQAHQKLSGSAAPGTRSVA